ncbi:hypothetical protein FALBO_10546 [Fusarium albosuccineum]|uniref:Uncharacterized protein n=1 Tax=Fusarium albosuccineum TaxID=1237068 RepID=A0A8H4L7J4_9HYPO|nr:hypothetical protein FALBO_10546 [Fusarium albosuccineum]
MALVVNPSNQHGYSLLLRWRRRLCSREILQLLHGSRQLTLSVAHPGSVNLDVGAPTSVVVVSPVPGALILMGPVLAPALACLNSSGPASGRHVMSGLARAVRFAACTNLPVQDYVPAGLCRQATAPHLSTYASRTHKVMPFLSFLHVLWLVASPLAEPVLNKWFRSWTYWVTQPIDHPSPLACAEQPVYQIDVLDLVW